MQVILLENINRLGKIGEVVRVRDGYARNFLIPRKIAVRATKENLVFFENRRAEIEAQNLQKKQEAQAVLEVINGASVTLVRQAGEDGRLYGSVTSKDIATAITDKSGHAISYTVVILNNKFKEIGIYPITLQLHAEVVATINLNIARNEEEAKVAESKAAKVIKDAESTAPLKKEHKAKSAEPQEEETPEPKKKASKKKAKDETVAEEEALAPKKAAKKATAADAETEEPAKAAKPAAKQKAAKKE